MSTEGTQDRGKQTYLPTQRDKRVEDFFRDHRRIRRETECKQSKSQEGGTIIATDHEEHTSSRREVEREQSKS